MRCGRDNTVRETQAAAAFFIHKLHNTYIMSKVGVSHPRHLNKVLQSVLTYSSSLACFGATSLTQLSIGQHRHQVGAGPTSAPLASRENDNNSVLCTRAHVCMGGGVCYSVKVLFLIGHPCLVGVSFSEDQKTNTIKDTYSKH